MQYDDTGGYELPDYRTHSGSVEEFIQYALAQMHEEYEERIRGAEGDREMWKNYAERYAEDKKVEDTRIQEAERIAAEATTELRLLRVEVDELRRLKPENQEVRPSHCDICEASYDTSGGILPPDWVQIVGAGDMFPAVLCADHATALAEWIDDQQYAIEHSINSPRMLDDE